MGFGERLKQVREEAGITQVKLAAEIGVARSNISSWEGGAFGLPASDVLVRIAKYFERSERWFVTGEDGAELGPFAVAKRVFLSGAPDRDKAQQWLDSTAFRMPSGNNESELVDTLRAQYARHLRAIEVAEAGGTTREIGLSLGGVGSRIDDTPDEEPHVLPPLKKRKPR